MISLYFFIAAGKRSAIKSSLHSQTDTEMNMWFFKTARGQLQI